VQWQWSDEFYIAPAFRDPRSFEQSWPPLHSLALRWTRRHHIHWAGIRDYWIVHNLFSLLNNLTWSYSSALTVQSNRSTPKSRSLLNRSQYWSFPNISSPKITVYPYLTSHSNVFHYCMKREV
jgi:hypothetical protein